MTDRSGDDGPQSVTRRRVLGTLAAIAAGSSGLAAGATQVSGLVDKMSIDQKVHMVHGHDKRDATGWIAPLHDLGIPGIRMFDGPVGVRTESETPMTAFPASIAAAASFDPELMERQGRAMGREAKAVDAHQLLGPALNIQRVPVCGRNFEYYSEDPLLTAAMAAASTRGIQSEDVVATPKHFAANTQETRRKYVSSEVSERALREIYLPGYRATVEAGALSMMSAYNRVNGTYCTEHEVLLSDVLKDEWGFEGFVVSDWGAMGSTVDSALAGQDVEMWEDEYYGADLRRAVENGEVPESQLDEMVTRVLTAFAETGHLDGSIGPGERNTTAHRDLAREIAEEGATLLKNDGALPIDPDAVDRIGVVGRAIDDALVGGGGAAEVTPADTVSPLEGIQEFVDGRAEIRTGRDPSSAARVASEADVTLAFGQVYSSEFEDRSDMHLERRDDELIQQAASSGPTVAVVHIPGPIVMPWVDDVDGVLSMWYPGMEDGTATANVVFGDCDPGGKLPTTFGQSFDDYPVSEQRQYPGENDRVHFDEGVFVGYRHFDAAGVDPLYPFGHGLSYTEFAIEVVDAPAGYDPTTEDRATVSVEVTNTGSVAGSEVVQVYVEERDPAVERPPKELSGFQKVRLDPGTATTVEIDLDRSAFAYFDPDARAWAVDDGQFRIHVGASSRDVRETVDIAVGESGLTPVDGVVPRDIDGDGIHEDFNANGKLDFPDVNRFFQQTDSAAVQDHVGAYDLTGDAIVDQQDVLALFEAV
ncbi:glycoside hydrolase family 3 N-terminal domain-containing protein [Halococcoides cellulosivorans]|uniref:Glycosyl hydrolase n=1 Tax=Halococcoides cellulosivorans TaxID=1679096 RepID=A0A2R4X2P3_9EURY|nr:glycoside hydrolase family 3 N-terminal domain-containing protein [Halococcoides cellulosivorans]AWB28071.1 glycosyl hydrolase [Halococcoides cellulosivorans]